MTTWTHGPVPADIRAAVIRLYPRNERAEQDAILAKGAWFADGRLGAWTILCRGHLLLGAPNGTMTEVARGCPGALGVVAETLDEQVSHVPATTQLREAGMNLSLLPSSFMASLKPEEQRRRETRPTYQRKVGGSRKAKIQLFHDDDSVTLFSETQSSARSFDFALGGSPATSIWPVAVPSSNVHAAGVAAALRVIAAKTARPSSIPYLEDLAIAA